MSRVNMTARHFHRLLAAIFLIIINLAPHQTVQSAESGLSNFGSASVPTKEFQALAKSSRYSDVLGSAYRILDRGSEYGAETGKSLVESLMKHALVRQQAGENLQAEQAAELVVELIERNGGVFDPGLVDSLVFLAASFVVLPNGSVDDVELVASNAPAPMRTLFRKEVRRSIYRPRFVDGEPVATAEHLREEFAGTALAANAKPAGN